MTYQKKKNSILTICLILSTLLINFEIDCLEMKKSLSKISKADPKSSADKAGDAAFGIGVAKACINSVINTMSPVYAGKREEMLAKFQLAAPLATSDFSLCATNIAVPDTISF